VPYYAIHAQRLAEQMSRPAARVTFPQPVTGQKVIAPDVRLTWDLLGDVMTELIGGCLRRLVEQIQVLGEAIGNIGQVMIRQMERRYNYDGRDDMPVYWSANAATANSGVPVTLTGTGTGWLDTDVTWSNSTRVTFTVESVDIESSLDYIRDRYARLPYRYGLGTGYVVHDETLLYQQPPWQSPADQALTEEERVARAAERERRMEAERERQERVRAETERLNAERAAAQERATEFLRSLLDDRQILQLDRRERIEVLGSRGTRFAIDPRHVDGNVWWSRDPGDVEDGQPVCGRICCHPASDDTEGRRIPIPDLIAGQVLAVQTDEATFCAAANVYDNGRPSYRVGPSADSLNERDRARLAGAANILA
jgi:hypothetical protein